MCKLNWYFLDQNGILTRGKKGIIIICYNKKGLWGLFFGHTQNNVSNLLLINLISKFFIEILPTK